MTWMTFHIFDSVKLNKINTFQLEFAVTLSYEVRDHEVSLGTDLCCLRESVTNIRKNYFCLLQCIYSHIFFFHWGSGNSQVDSQVPITVFSSMLLLFGQQVMSNSLWPHRLQHARPPCPSPSPGACQIDLVMLSNHLILWHPLFMPSIFPGIKVFSNESAVCTRWPKYWNFNFSIIH